MSALLRDEAELRARLLDVSSYAVTLDLTRGEEGFRSTAVIRFACAEPGAASFVDIDPGALLRAELNGHPLDPATLDGGRLPLPGLAAANELLVEADMPYSRTAEGLHRFTDPADGEVYVYTACAPDLAAKVFACFDQPDLKAPFTFTVAAPEGWTVAGNGATSRLPDGRWQVGDIGPISSYLTTVVAGPLHVVRAEHDGIPLALYARRSLAAELDREAPELFELTSASLDRLHQLFDVRYPFGGYDQAFLPELNWAAMESPGCVTFEDRMLFRSAPTDAQRALRAVVVCHEMAHMWFGNLVTLGWWDDVWLNESFAEVLGYRIAAEATRYTGAWTLFSARKSWGYDADQRPTTHPVAATGAASVAEALSNFDGISYAKGASALHQLMHRLGDKAFFAGLNTYFARHARGNASLSDFIDALASAAGPQVPEWADTWLRTTGVDVLRVEVEEAADGTVASAALVNDGSRPHRVRVGVHGWDGAALVPGRPLDADVAPGGRTALPELAGAPRPALLLPNDGDLTWARVRLDDRSAATVTASLSAVADESGRAVLWEHLRDLTRGAELPAAAYLDLVAAHLPAESSDSIVASVLDFSRDHVAARYLDPAERPAALVLLGDAAHGVLGRPGAGRGLRIAALRGVIATATGEDRLARLTAWLDGRDQPEGLAFDANLRWAALSRLAAAGAAGEDRIAAELARDPSDTGELGAARARAALPDPAAKERAWQRLFTPGALTTPLLTATAEGFWLSGTPELRQDYVRRYFEQVPAAAEERGDAVAEALGRRLFPATEAHPATLAAARECLARTDLTPTLRRHLADGLDDLHRTLAHHRP
ncbi:putative aminopeptidase N [Actinacidiphila reveromycinica]|uniref:Aminopeptidase N n=1 Tax=Actinacidiphila reveromycinica TaxID=659352 RepID=A0A7U3UUH2_9ACTN|nr:aminopeptidase N [Streptomyces sp. SN-593]BBA98984.1 putative aminopeptidase N [Streptomyces sp. SN-593]